MCLSRVLGGIHRKNKKLYDIIRINKTIFIYSTRTPRTICHLTDVTLSENPAYQSLDEDTVKVLSVTLNMPKLWDERDSFIHINEENKEEFDMCQAMRELLADARAEGITTVVINMLKRGMSTEDICALAECSEEFVEKVRAEL